ncbi:UDP-N-acetylmuramate dehydrogenase [Ectothiorhodospiraceae bacterium 2226]|nr:UDP-N-acetylmuramate dehydrogenase [Ectothiorhodospiraceae bacterium 2226]
MNALPRVDDLRGRLLHDEPLARHTSWRVGGPADRFYLPADIDDLALFLSELPAGEPVFWLGLGSNLLVRDGGLRGTVVCTSGVLNGLARQADGTLRAEAGVPCAKVARLAAREGLGGAEFLGGIPGTMGGALAMNAGAFGGETWSLVAAVETLGPRGERHLRTPAQYRIGYRDVQPPVAGECFVAAHLCLPPADEDARARTKALLARRNATQPTSQPNAGSVFRNPPGDHAARLIETAGLKGLREGGAWVSEKHANFIVHAGEACAADIERLIERVAAKVAEVHGVTLVREVRIVGVAAEEGR